MKSPPYCAAPAIVWAQRVPIFLVLLALPACLAPIDGTQSAPVHSLCDGTCVPGSACSLPDAGDQDAGDDTSADDSSFDSTPDPGDAEQDETPSALSEAGTGAADDGLVDAVARDAAGNDVVSAEAGAPRMDAALDVKRLDASTDPPPLLGRDAADGPPGDATDARDTPILPDISSESPDSSSRDADASLPCVGCNDAEDVSSLPDGSLPDSTTSEDTTGPDTNDPASLAGRTIVIGHDYLTGEPNVNRILGNAVFLRPHDPVRLVTYAGAANPIAMAGVNAAIAQVATDNGRQVQRVAATAADVPMQLAQADVFLIYGQEEASNSALAQLALTWKSALLTFLKSGGTVILLDGFYVANGGTCQILAQSGRFAITRGADVTNTSCGVVASGDALATGVPPAYLCAKDSVNFATTETGSAITTVVTSGRSVVIYKTF
jgi:hypothetical protein